MSIYYRYLYKDSTGNTFSSVNPGGYIGAFDNTAETVLKYPRKDTIDITYLFETSSVYYNDCSAISSIKIDALENTINFYRANSKYYDINYYKNNTTTIVNIPSTIYGSSIKRGSISLKFYFSGSKIGELQDIKQNGELVQVYPTSSASGYNQTAGIVLYNEGFMLLTASWALDNTYQDKYLFCKEANLESFDYPRWIHWGRGIDNAPILSSSFDIDFQGTSKINTLTMFANAPKSELNFSQNPTFIKYDHSTSSFNNTIEYIEDSYVEVKNTIKDTYNTTTSSFERQVFINKIGIYDKDKNLIAVAKLSTPVKKTQDRSFTFKLKLDT